MPASAWEINLGLHSELALGEVGSLLRGSLRNLSKLVLGHAAADGAGLLSTEVSGLVLGTSDLGLAKRRERHATHARKERGEGEC